MAQRASVPLGSWIDHHGDMNEVPIRDDTIRLGQFLKLAGVVGSGAEVKDLLALTDVRVNGVEEHRRGRQLQRGDQVTVDGEPFAVV